MNKEEKAEMTEFIEINGDIFKIDKVHAMKRINEKNRLGNDSGIFILEIHMEGGYGSTSKMYSSKKLRDEDFEKAREQLEKSAVLRKGYSCK